MDNDIIVYSSIVVTNMTHSYIAKCIVYTSQPMPTIGPTLYFRITVIPCLSFFFSSRRRHTRLQGDWSSDVCSSDLVGLEWLQPGDNSVGFAPESKIHLSKGPAHLAVLHLEGDGVTLNPPAGGFPPRSEERRVGKECRSRWSPYH